MFCFWYRARHFNFFLSVKVSVLDIYVWSDGHSVVNQCNDVLNVDNNYSRFFPSSQGVAFFLVGVVIAARTLAYNFSVSIPIGIAVVAAFLFCVAVMGLVGLFRHNQVIMFFVSFLDHVCWCGDW